MIFHDKGDFRESTTKLPFAVMSGHVSYKPRVFCKPIRPNAVWYWYEEVCMDETQSTNLRRAKHCKTHSISKSYLTCQLCQCLAFIPSMPLRSLINFTVRSPQTLTPCPKQEHRPKLFSVPCCWRLRFFLERLGTHLGRPVGQKRSC